jgi:hypothetical protein
MRIQEILALIRARPFVPFRIHLLDGRTYEVLHPELVMPGARSILVGFNANPALPYFDAGRHEILSLLAISSLEPVSAAKPSGNGQG